MQNRTLTPIFSIAVSIALVFVFNLMMVDRTFAQQNSDPPVGVTPLTWQPSSEKLAIDTVEARQLYDRIRNGDYPGMQELKESPVTTQLDALSQYYFNLYGNTADIHTQEREEIRAKVLREFLSIGAARKTEGQGNVTGKTKYHYVYDAPLSRNYKMTLVMGLPAVGKSTVYTNPTSEKTGAFILDCDVVKSLLPEYKESHGGAADAVHFESLNIMDDAMQAFLTGDKRGINVILPIVATDFDELMEKYIKPFESAGYDVRAVFLIAPENVSFARNIARQLDTGRMFRSAVAASFGQKPEKVYYRLKNMTNAKGHPYGMAEYPFQEH